MNRRSFLAGTTALLWPPPARADFQSALHAEINAVAGSLALYARTMDGAPPRYSYRAHESFPSASIIKLVIMAAAFRSADRDRSLLRTRVPVMRSDMVGGSETFGSAVPGRRYPMLALIHAMIRKSDNTAANALISHFGFDRINAVAARGGLSNTHLRRHFLDWFAIVRHHENVTTAADVGNLLFQLERGAREAIPTIASPWACRHMIEIMLGQEDRTKIPAGLPAGVAVANKTGELDGARSDAAIVEPFGEVPYVLTILTKNLRDYASAFRAIRRISRLVYAELSG